MKVSYKKLWKILIDLEIDKQTLASVSNISASTLTKMTKGMSVNMEMLVRICTALDCDLHDIVELVPDGAENDNKVTAQLRKKPSIGIKIEPTKEK